MIGHVDADPAIVAESCSPAAAAPALQQPRRLLSVTGSTLAWAQRAAWSMTSSAWCSTTLGVAARAA
jgi:hypothetical protein